MQLTLFLCDLEPNLQYLSGEACMKNNTHIHTKSTVQTICPAQDLKNVEYLYLINKNKNNDYVKEEKTRIEYERVNP